MKYSMLFFLGQRLQDLGQMLVNRYQPDEDAGQSTEANAPAAYSYGKNNAAGPPAHWLELVKQQAPWLLDEIATDSGSRETFCPASSDAPASSIQVKKKPVPYSLTLDRHHAVKANAEQDLAASAPGLSPTVAEKKLTGRPTLNFALKPLPRKPITGRINFAGRPVVIRSDKTASVKPANAVPKPANTAERKQTPIDYLRLIYRSSVAAAKLPAIAGNQQALPQPVTNTPTSLTASVDKPEAAFDGSNTAQLRQTAWPSDFHRPAIGKEIPSPSLSSAKPNNPVHIAPDKRVNSSQPGHKTPAPADDSFASVSSAAQSRIKSRKNTGAAVFHLLAAHASAKAKANTQTNAVSTLTWPQLDGQGTTPVNKLQRWPELPEDSWHEPSNQAHSFAASDTFRHEQDRRMRLDFEQRGIPWNE